MRLVSHKLDEVLQATDRITIMRAGRVVDELPTSHAEAPALARSMVGRDVSLREAGAALGTILEDTEGAAAAADTDVVLRIRDLKARGPDGNLILQGLSLDVRAGEILGLAGVEG